MKTAIAPCVTGSSGQNSNVAARVLREMRGGAAEEVNPFVELTNREMDVLNLIAEGQSNSEIAKNLVISDYTVKGHVSNILSKLHLNDRTQAAVYARRKGLKRNRG